MGTQARVVNSLPTLPTVPLPNVLRGFNKRYSNRLMRHVAVRAPGFGVIHHTGRVTGSMYRTPINVFRCGERHLAPLTYGCDVDWVKNVLAGPADCVIRGRQYMITSPELVTDGELSECMPAPVRAALRVLRVGDYLLMDLEPS